MHKLQEKLLKLLEEKNVNGMTLREIGDLIGEKFPQKVKHHLIQLEKKGFISMDSKNKEYRKIKLIPCSSRYPLLGLPIVDPQLSLLMKILKAT